MGVELAQLDDLSLTRPLVRVQRCGKSAPAALRSAGSVNPGWKQGRRDNGWSFPGSR